MAAAKAGIDLPAKTYTELRENISGVTSEKKELLGFWYSMPEVEDEIQHDTKAIKSLSV